MRNFLLGVIVGAVGATWYSQTRGQLDIDRQFAQMQERANAVLTESRRILEETRQELAAALEAGRHSVQQTTERIRNQPTAGEAGPATGESTPPTA
jgi:hypothetical protein